MKAYQLKITLKHTHPPVWRRIIVPAGLSFSQLSVVLNEVMDWDGSHLFCFEFHNQRLRIEETSEDDWGMWDMDVLEASETIIDEFLDDDKKFTYVYDFGDNWEHTVEVEKILTDYDKSCPTVLKYKGDSPIEDCGGICGFYDMKGILENPSDSEYEELSEWAPDGVSIPFNIEEKNTALEALFITKKKHKPMKQSDIYNGVEAGKGFGRIYDEMPFTENIFSEKNYFMSGGRDEDVEEILSGLDEYFRDLMRNSKSFPQIEYSEEITLKDIYQDYKKEELTELARIHELRGYTKFKKAELIDFLTEQLLDKDVMCRYFTFLSDEVLELIKKFSDSANYGMASEEETENALPLLEGGYAGCHGFRDIIVPKEVAEAYQRNCDGEWKKLRRETLELLYYLNGAAELYGICPIEKALEIYRKYTGKRMEELAVYDFCESVPEGEQMFLLDGNRLVHGLFFYEEKREELEKEQQGKEFYMPTKKEILTLGREGYLPFDESMKSLEAFLNIFLEDAPGAAAALCKYAQYMIRMGMSLEEIQEDLEDKGIFEDLPDKTAEATFTQLLAKAWQRTRKMSNRGSLPRGITRKENILTALADSQEKAEVVKFPVDLNKKIYPNDPCPCGSGKKYKKCCGRNKKQADGNA